MIFLFDTSLIDKTNAKPLADALKSINAKKHKIDYKSPSVWQFVETEVLTTSNIGKDDIDLILQNRELRDIKNSDRNYYTQITIGTDTGMCDLNTLSVILNTVSCIVLENASYDWCAIKKWIDFVKNDNMYKDINRKVNDAICRKWIVPEHAGGGNGTISLRIESLVRDVYFAAGPAKITTIYDSDKQSSIDDVEHNASLKKYLVQNGYQGHEWVKREIENYIPLRVYKYAHLVNEDEDEPDTTPSVWNYICINKHPYFKKYKKNKMPELSEMIDKSATKEAFIDKVFVNHVDNRPISELQHVIFHLAKYI